MSPFEQLLKELGTILNLSLRPDDNQACLLSYQNGATVQIEHDLSFDRILLGSELGKLDPGIYREKIFKEAMRANSQLILGQGILAYSEKNGTLVLYSYIPYANLNGQILAQYLELFLENVNVWMHALKTSDIPKIEEYQKTGSGLFGLR